VYKKTKPHDTLSNNSNNRGSISTSQHIYMTRTSHTRLLAVK